jgi:hypothetical protein
MPDATNGQGSASADEFDRELRELTEGTAGMPLFIEPSAAERARSATVRVSESAMPEGRLARVVVAVVVLLAGVMVVWFGYTRSAGSADGAPPAAPVSGPSASPELMGTISPIDLFNLPPQDPFIRSPADHWADGAAGIVAPAARPVGTFTAAQVAAAYRMTRALLIAANLERRTLLGGAPTAFARLLTPRQRAMFLAGLDKTGVDKAGNPLSTRTWVASFAPGSAELIGTVVKVHGGMSARAVGKSGTVVLAIEVNYLFTYAVEPPGNPTAWMRVVDHEYGSIDFARWDDPRGSLEPWDQATIGAAGVQCGTGDGYIHPDYPSYRSIDTRPAGPLINAYSSATGTPGRGTACGRTMGT